MIDIAFAAFGGAWLAIFMLAFIVVGVIANELDSFFMSAATLLIGFVGLQWMFGLPIWQTIAANPFVLILYIAVYVAVGSLITGLWSWPNYIREHAKDIDYAFEEYVRSQKRGGHEVTFDQFLDSRSYEFRASNRKDQLAAWVMMWPFGLLWDLIHRPARWIWNAVYYNLGDVFETISKYTARKIHEKNK
jgi:hypothetical protein